MKCLLVMFLFILSCEASPRNYLSRGYSISIEDGLEILVSPNKTFTCGLYGSGGNAYYLSIWYTSSRDRTVVWMANRDKPVNGEGSKLTFLRTGAMVLTDVDGTIAWESNTTSTTARKAELMDSGNLVLKDSSGHVLWESFDNPTDTLLPNQPITKDMKLVSSIGRGSYYSGYFSFYFDNDNVLKMMYDGPDISSLYWPNPDLDTFQNGRTDYNSTRIAVLDDFGVFESSDRFNFNASDRGLGITRRLKIDHDGNLRLYSLNGSDGTWAVTWEAMTGMCRIHGICGRNSVCIYTPDPMCSCPPGYEVSDPTNWNSGCKPKFNVTCSEFSSADSVQFVELPHSDFYGFDFIYNSSTTIDWCRNACLADCNCLAYVYTKTGNQNCYGKGSLFNGYTSPDFPSSLYLKLPASIQVPSVITKLNGSLPVCSSGENIVLVGSATMYDSIVRRIKWAYLYWFVGVIGVTEIIIFFFGWLILFRKQGVPEPVEEGYRALSSQFRKFRYKELKVATWNFKEEIGRGGSGIVYKGKLGDGREVAVKRLGDVHHGEDFFWAEVSTIGKMNHMNLARMWGFCAEGKNRLLVYEFIENKSLDKHLFGSSHLRWKDRFRIALGAAKGLAYLHHECLEWVIHCDVKPENLLLDSAFEPKISDFGLAKLLQRANVGSDFSMIRGTKGYMAPEWASNLPITAKVDVFSYGVTILEMVRGVRVSNWAIEDDETVGEAEGSQLTNFARVVQRKIKLDKGHNKWIEEFMDPRLRGRYSKKQAAVLVEVGLSCIEEDRNKRPNMGSIVDALLECADEPKAPTKKKR